MQYRISAPLSSTGQQDCSFAFTAEMQPEIKYNFKQNTQTQLDSIVKKKYKIFVHYIHLNN